MHITSKKIFWKKYKIIISVFCLSAASTPVKQLFFPFSRFGLIWRSRITDSYLGYFPWICLSVKYNQSDLLERITQHPFSTYSRSDTSFCGGLGQLEVIRCIPIAVKQCNLIVLPSILSSPWTASTGGMTQGKYIALCRSVIWAGYEIPLCICHQFSVCA